MSKKEILNIEIELGYLAGDDLKQCVKKSIEENLSEFEIYAGRLIEKGELRLEVLNESYQINDFEFDEQSLQGNMGFSFDSWYYSGCKGNDGLDQHDSERNFEFSVDIKNGKISFYEIELPRAWLPDLAMEDY